jgi:hypothetical protein
MLCCWNCDWYFSHYKINILGFFLIIAILKKAEKAEYMNIENGVVEED